MNPEDMKNLTPAIITSTNCSCETNIATYRQIDSWWGRLFNKFEFNCINCGCKRKIKVKDIVAKCFTNRPAASPLQINDNVSTNVISINKNKGKL